MQAETYTKNYPKFGTFTVGNTPAGTTVAKVNGLFDEIKGLVEKSAISPEMGHVAIGALFSAWGPVANALGGKLSN